MKARIQKIEDTFVLRIPEVMAKEAKLIDGMVVDVDFAEGDFHVEPAKPPKYKLEEMVEGITEENRHEETSWGKPDNSPDDESLEEMLDRITDDNVHKLIDKGGPQGREIW